MNQAKQGRSSVRWLVVAAVVSGLLTLGVAALLTNITERRMEARDAYVRVVDIGPTTDDPAEWGKNFPLHYDRYAKTVDMTRTRYGGSEALPRRPSADDPRTVVSASRLEDDPRLVELWAGYAFAADFREERGHAYMLLDQLFTERQRVKKQPGTCLHCHASVYVPYLKAGAGDLTAGFERVNRMPYDEAKQLVEHPVSCIDCHDPASLRLRVTRPAFMMGIRALKERDGIAGYDVNRDAPPQEMRTYICAQCHVEYHFQGPEKRLVYPWAKGLRADEILAFYDESGFADWTHAISGAPMLKAQHPEFELHSQGIHARSGVACADCHMPYLRVGARKVSDHWVRSPLLNVENACQTCHRWSEAELSARVHAIQDRTHEMRDLAIDAVLDLARAIGARAAAAPDDEQLGPARALHRKAQFLADFIEAENSMGFHADQEAVRVLGKAIDYARRGHVALLGGEVRERAPPPQTVTPPP